MNIRLTKGIIRRIDAKKRAFYSVDDDSVPSETIKSFVSANRGRIIQSSRADTIVSLISDTGDINIRVFHSSRATRGTK